MIKVSFSCDGCHVETMGTDFLHSRFNGVTGKNYGFGSWEQDGAKDVCPDGWIAFDPYTQCTYCPDCWAEIFRPTESAAVEKAKEPQ